MLILQKQSNIMRNQVIVVKAEVTFVIVSKEKLVAVKADDSNYTKITIKKYRSFYIHFVII